MAVFLMNYCIIYLITLEKKKKLLMPAMPGRKKRGKHLLLYNNNIYNYC